jgi:SAM-dependent methyltransferase
MILSKLFDFPFSSSRFNGFFDFYGRRVLKLIEAGLQSFDKESHLLDIGAGSRKYAKIVERLNLRYTSCDLPGSPNEKNQDFLCDASELTVSNCSYELCLHIQVLEHLRWPQISIDEVARVLKPGGRLLLSTNFLYPIHGEPYDYFRFTKHGLESLLENSGIRVISIEEIGGFFKFLSTGLQYQRDFLFGSKFLSPRKIYSKVLLTPFRLLINIFLVFVILTLNQLDRLIYLPKFTSGYFVVGEKH